MALDPLTVGFAALAGYGLYSHSRHNRRVRRTKPAERPKLEPIPKTPLVIAEDCSSWEMPETWIIQTAQPRFYRKLLDIHAAVGGELEKAKERGLLDPVALTYHVLEGEVGSCPVPLRQREDGSQWTFRDLQSDIPQHEDYYPHPAILGLYDTIFEAVEAALLVLDQTHDPAKALLFPV